MGNRINVVSSRSGCILSHVTGDQTDTHTHKRALKLVT